MPNVQKNFIEPIVATMNVQAADPSVLFADLERTLCDFSDATLRKAADKIRTSRPREGFFRDPLTFPSVAECVEWCASTMPNKPSYANDDSREWERRAFIADQKINSDLGRLAAREGWIMNLWSHWHFTDKDPSESQVHKFRRTAITNEDIDRDCEDMSRHVTFRMISKSMRAKRKEKIDLAMQGEPVE